MHALSTSSIFEILKFNRTYLRFMVYGRKQANKHIRIHTHFSNAVTLVWGSLRFAPIILPPDSKIHVVSCPLSSLFFPGLSFPVRPHAIRVVLPLFYLWRCLHEKKYQAFSTKPAQLQCLGSRTEELGYVEYKHLVHGYHAAVGKHFEFKRGLKNTVGTYCGSKDRRFIRHWAKSCHAFAMSHLRVLKRTSHAK